MRPTPRILATLILALALGLASCGGADKGGGADEPGGGGGSRGLLTTAAATGTLDVDLRVWSRQGGNRIALAPEDRLRSGDRIELEVDVSKPVYVYVVQFFADGTSTVLYPEAGDELVRPGGMRVPGGDELFQLDEHTGEEHIYVVASATPLGDADATLAGHLGDIRASGSDPGYGGEASGDGDDDDYGGPDYGDDPFTPDTDEAVSPPPRRDDDGEKKQPSKPRKKKASSGGGSAQEHLLTMASRGRDRGLIKIHADEDGASTITGRSANGELVVVEFWFHHDP